MEDDKVGGYRIFELIDALKAFGGECGAHVRVKVLNAEDGEWERIDYIRIVRDEKAGEVFVGIS